LISAEQFARGRSSYWAERLPRLDGFVRAVNIEGGRFSPPINSEVDPDRHAFIAELAFELLRLQVEHGSAPTQKQHSQAASRVRRRIGRLAGIDEREIRDPTRTEYAEIVRLREALKEFLDERTPTRILAGPKIAGCGIVDACCADLLLEREFGPSDRSLGDLDRSTLRLFEVKTVERGFRAADFRQLITYAALMSAAGHAPEAVGLVNPRRGTFFECTMEELAKDTAGLGGDELLQQIVFDVSATEISL
jgi:hypothetical protein